MRSPLIWLTAVIGVKSGQIGLLGISIMLLVVLSTVFCCETKAKWVSSAVQVPDTKGLRVEAVIQNVGDAILALMGRDATSFMEDQWMITIAVSNSTNELVATSLPESAVIMPSNRSWSLVDLAQGKLPASIPPYSYVRGSFRLPDAKLSSGSIIKLYLTWYDSKGRHAAYWSWVLEEVQEPVRVQQEAPKQQPQSRPRSRFNGWYVLLGLLLLGIIGTIGQALLGD